MGGQKLGQNFLQDINIAMKIVDSLPLFNGPVIEIGPGRGILTRILTKMEKGNKIIAVEKDPGLYEELMRSDLGGAEIWNKDILSLGIEEISAGDQVSILGNIPYFISKEIIDWIITGSENIGGGTLMVQKEFFTKITSAPGSKLYNARSVIFGHIYNSVKIFNVQPGSFSPPPKVISTVFSFKKVVGSPGTNFILYFYTMLKRAFGHRRKTLINNLGKTYDKNTINRFLERKFLPADIRAEDMSCRDLRDLYLSLH